MPAVFVHGVPDTFPVWDGVVARHSTPGAGEEGMARLNSTDSAHA